MTETSTTDPETRAPTSLNGRGSGAVDPTPVVELGTTRRRWPAVLVGLAVGIGGTVAATTILDRRTTTDSPDAVDVELATAPVEQRDLVEEIEWSGTLGYGEPVTIAGSGGTITAATTVGTTIGRGDEIVEVDGRPIVALYGATPMWRPLSSGDIGADVRVLEANLSALGHDPDQTVDIDDTFTANTAAMVERWQESLGVDVTGTVLLGSFVVIEGPSVVTTVAEVGSAATGDVAVVAPRGAVIDVVATVDGVVTGLAEPGVAVDHGTVLYRVDDVPVVAIVEPDAGQIADDPVSAALTDPTFTALELEQALTDGGHDPDGEMTVDGVITDATRAAVERWQATGGLAVTGSTDPGFYLAVPPELFVAEQPVVDGASIVDGGPVLTLSTSRLAVEVTVDVDEADEFELGQEATIELADESTVVGVVAEIGPVVQAADPQGTATVTIELTLTVADGAEPVEGPVTVVSTGEVIADATVVPTRALLSLAEGGFAVERVVAGGAPELVGIELGSFDDGVVEVVDGDLAPGDEVVVPR